jgi:hypothetical protein
MHEIAKVYYHITHMPKVNNKTEEKMNILTCSYEKKILLPQCLCTRETSTRSSYMEI